MRPRVFPAEDALRLRMHLRGPGCFNEAAGIPRGRHHSRISLSTGAIGFNEAAGIPRGRPPRGRESSPAQRASMRPRVFPAEDAEFAGEVGGVP